MTVYMQTAVDVYFSLAFFTDLNFLRHYSNVIALDFFMFILFCVYQLVFGNVELLGHLKI